MPGLVPGIHVFLSCALKARRGWPGIGEQKRRRPSDGYAGHDGVWSRSPKTSNQILFGDDFAEPAVVPDEFLDEFMDAMLEDIIQDRKSTRLNSSHVAISYA